MLMKTRERQYFDLVQERRSCFACGDELKNPACVEDEKHDSNHIGPWSIWQGNLQANLVVVGQDWGTIKYFQDHEGEDQKYGNRTNENLRKLLTSIGINIEPPRTSQAQQIFLTNAIMCLKRGTLQAPVKDEWFQNCGPRFLRPLIQIIKPKVVVALGMRAYKAILQAYSIPYKKTGVYRKAVDAGSLELPDDILLFPVYHCGAWITNTHRKMDAQLRDWERIGMVLSS